jgi:hypothetical protein
MLLLSYHFPPGQAVGALRWQKMAGIAAERGWLLDVVTLAQSSLPSADLASLKDLPPGLRVYGVPQTKLVREHLEQWVWRLYSRLKPKRKETSPRPHPEAPATSPTGSDSIMPRSSGPPMGL